MTDTPTGGVWTDCDNGSILLLASFMVTSTDGSAAFPVALSD